MHTRAEGSSRAAHFPEQQEKITHFAKAGPQLPGVGQRRVLAHTAAAATLED